MAKTDKQSECVLVCDVRLANNADDYAIQLVDSQRVPGKALDPNLTATIGLAWRAGFEAGVMATKDMRQQGNKE